MSDFTFTSGQILSLKPFNTEPRKCHANFVLAFSFLDFFLAFKFLSRLFSRLFSPLITYIKASFMGRSASGDMARFDSWLCNYFIFRWKCNTVQFDLPTFLSYNKAMLSQEMLLGATTIWEWISKRSSLAACRVNPLFLYKVCGIWRAFLIFLVLGGEETVVTPRGCFRCKEIALRGSGSQGLRTL